MDNKIEVLREEIRQRLASVKDLSELDMPEKDPPTPDNGPPTTDRDLEKEPEPAPGEKPENRQMPDIPDQPKHGWLYRLFH